MIRLRSMTELTDRGQQPATTMTGVAVDELTRLSAIEAIRRLKATYCRLLDTQQWDELAALFVPDAHFVLATAGEPVEFDNVSAWVANLRSFLPGARTVHQVPQAEIDVVDADTVTARWAMVDYVIPLPTTGRAPFYGYGHYLEHYRRVSGNWKIVSLELTRLILGEGAPPAAPPLH